ncbi:MAG: copper chaperone PCu(A)C [Bacteroidota bacterium]|nr:copper chaperone PCu(A)C [Candidatus Kapabacteria bacterium]MCS7302747.1 copper chaperone PCu(A)C [Candidatus Kapabacteria bacterium]MCX7937236.1 copper chaperone PCu(A)C [Chlorobiota bacterium]MDW8075751.1 copper chaperone PCu(A)C [Bacteroidota bacterium]MDW8272497.1 copper chaperone PCu(A)C [Bacteroidota bacterium]
MKLIIVAIITFVGVHASAQVASLQLKNGWMYSADSGMITGAFLTIQNRSPQPDTIIAAIAECAEHTEIHTTVRNEDGTMGMRPIPELIVPSRGSLVLKPRSLHIMLYHLRKTLRPGDRCILFLRSKRHGTLKTELIVRR